MFFDAALIYDPQTLRCDMELGDDGDLLIDDTSITPVLMSVGLDRRANDDDVLPDGVTAFRTSIAYDERRGSPCDAIDHKGELAGTRCWLLNRAKETKLTAQLYDLWLHEGLQWAEAETGIPAKINVEWGQTGRLHYSVLVADADINIASNVVAVS